MKIQISDNIIKHYLKNVYFINGHSCAGKSTMAKMFSKQYDMILCGENYHDTFPREKLSRWKQLGLCYFDTMNSWEEWLNMTPEEHWNWTNNVSQECVEIEILELIRLAANGKRVIVDTNIPPNVLREISDYLNVAILLCDPPDICTTRFFERDDPDKKFMLEQTSCVKIQMQLSKISIHGRYIIPHLKLTGIVHHFLHILVQILNLIQERKCLGHW